MLLFALLKGTLLSYDVIWPGSPCRSVVAIFQVFPALSLHVLLVAFQGFHFSSSCRCSNFSGFSLSSCCRCSNFSGFSFSSCCHCSNWLWFPVSLSLVFTRFCCCLSLSLPSCWSGLPSPSVSQSSFSNLAVLGKIT